MTLLNFFYHHQCTPPPQAFSVGSVADAPQLYCRETTYNFQIVVIPEKSNQLATQNVKVGTFKVFESHVVQGPLKGPLDQNK